MSTQCEWLPAESSAAENELDCLFNNTIGLLCTVGFDGRFQRLSAGWTATLGWSPGELAGMPVVDLVHPGDRAATGSQMAKLPRAPGTVVMENRCRCKGGGWKILRWNANSSAGGRTIHAMVQDVSEERDLERKVLDAEDAALDRVGRELHDDLGPSLAGVTALASGLTARLRGADRLEACAAAEIRDLLRQTSRAARDLAHGFSPAIPDAPSLNAALRQLTESVGTCYGIACDYDGHLTTLGRNRDAGRHLLRVAQEAVTNAIRHGPPTGVLIVLDQRAGWGQLRIDDDGPGFPREDLERRGMGLRSMEFRARAIGGSLHLGSAPPRGGRVTCRFPLADAAPPASP